MNENAKYIIQFVVVLVAAIFSIKLFTMQVLNEDYRQLANDNIVRKHIDYPYRGLITDRHGELIVHNAPIYDLMVVRKKMQIPDTTRFCAVFGIERATLEQKLKQRGSWFKPVVVKKQISHEEFARMQDFLVDYPGFFVQARTVRAYSHGALANALGYIGEISQRRLDADTSGYYKSGDYIGISGLEAQYEQQMRGTRGLQVLLVDVNGTEKGAFQEGLMDEPSVPGHDLISTIDLKLQQYAEVLMDGKVGSVIALEPATGEVLTMVSAPSYNPNLLSGRNFGANYTLLSKDTLTPLFNRPIMADVYPPGSIFKLLQTLIALEEGVITPETRFRCNRNIIACHGPHTNDNLQEAIKHSCNPYFYQTFRRIINQNRTDSPFKEAPIGLEAWRDYLLRFGLGRTLGIDLPNEKTGIIPTVALYDRVYGTGRWKFSNIYSLSIGQGELGVSPLQMANYAAIIANRGHYYIPHFAKGIGPDGQKPPRFLVKQETGVSPEHFEVVVDAMAEVVESGTGQYRAKLKDIEVCGKTGTVQNPHGEDHSVFIAFAPKDDPKIAVSVYVENAGQGARAAAAIAGLMIEKYLKGEDAELAMEEYVKKGHFIY